MKKYQVSIVLITEKQELSRYEEISLHRALAVFAKENVYLVYPETNDPGKFLDPTGITLLPLPVHHFSSVNTYSKLLLSGFFYEQFRDSEFILIHQLDCFVFHADFTPFLSFDYIGAPWINTQNHESEALIKTVLSRKPFISISRIFGWYLQNKIDAVGNGGLSLRRVDKFISINNDPLFLKLKAAWLKNKRPHEDIFYSCLVPLFDRNFKIADLVTASKFSIETHPQYCYELNNQTLPLGCHAWEKHDLGFWRPFFKSYGYEI